MEADNRRMCLRYEHVLIPPYWPASHVCSIVGAWPFCQVNGFGYSESDELPSSASISNPAYLLLVGIFELDLGGLLILGRPLFFPLLGGLPCGIVARVSVSQRLSNCIECCCVEKSLSCSEHYWLALLSVRRLLFFASL